MTDIEDKLRAQLKEAREIINDVSVSIEETCAWCGKDVFDGHDPSCRLAAFLEATK